MRIRTQRNIANGAAAVVMLLGCLAVGWGAIGTQLDSSQGLDSEGMSRKRDSASVEDSMDRQSNELAQLVPKLSRKLQGPLVPPARKPPTLPTAVVQKRNWPSVSLDCVIAGRSAKLAIFSSNNQSYSCSSGDRFLGLLVKSIGSTSAELEFMGETRTFHTSEPTKAKGTQK
jgi:hypothetical protein